MAINIDVSKAPHPQLLSVFDLIFAFMPGLFLEMCVVVANPSLVNSHIQPPLDRLMVIAFAVIGAFIFGNFFMLWTRFVCRVWIWLVGFAYGAAVRLWLKLLEYWLKAKGNPPQIGYFGKLKIVRNAHHRATSTFLFRQKLGRNWRRVAERIFEIYQLEPPGAEDPDGWATWVGVLGQFRKQDLRGSVVVLAVHATGWSGLTALHFAPRLHAKYFLAFCFLSIAISFVDCFWLAVRLTSPEISWRLGLLRTFDELKRATAVAQKHDTKEDGEGEEEAV